MKVDFITNYEYHEWSNSNLKLAVCCNRYCKMSVMHPVNLYSKDILFHALAKLLVNKMVN